MAYFYLIGTITLMGLGQVLFKLTADREISSKWMFVLTPTFLLAVVLYAAATLSWVLTLKSWPLSIAYPLTAVTYIAVVLVGLTVFKETLSPTQSVGIVAIVAGVILLAAK